MNLQPLILKVVSALGETNPDYVSFRFGSDEGKFGWSVNVAPRKNKAGRIERRSFHGFGETPEAAVEEILHQIHLDKDPADKEQAGMIAMFGDMLAKGEVTQEQHDRMVEKARSRS